VEASEGQLGEAVQAVRDALQVFEKSGRSPTDLARSLRLHFEELSSLYDRYQSFREATFWSTYRQTFSLFMETNVILQQDASEKDKSVYQSALKTMFSKLAFTRGPLG
jgi:hypothetical protein